MEHQSIILIVDDEAAGRETLEMLLAGQGYNLASASNGPEALEKAEELTPDLILLDVMMPGMGGFEVCQRLRADPILAEVPVIMVTALDDRNACLQGIEAGADDFVTKPFDRTELRARVRTITRLNRYRRLLLERTHRQQAEEEIRRRNEELAVLNAIAAVVSRSLDLDQILSDALDKVLRLDALKAEAGAMIFLLNEQTTELSLAVHRGVSEGHPCLVKPLRMGDCLCGLAAQQGKVIVSDDCWQDERHNRRWPEMPPHKDICLPLKVRGKVLGVMKVCLLVAQEVTPDGVKLWVSISDQIAVAIENAQLHKAERAAHEQLRDLTRYLQTARETERAHIAREIHDEFGQALTALKMDLAWLTKRLSADGPRLAEKASSMSDLIDTTIQTVRRVATELRPGVLDDLGLAAAIEWQAQDLADRTGIDCELCLSDEDIVLDRDLATAIFRIFQETLTNIARHAEATRVCIELEDRASELVLIVRDNGKGIVESQLFDSKSLGLIGMQERARAWGGEVTFQGVPGQGTTVTLRIPRTNVEERRK